MRKLLTVPLAALVAGAAFVACDRLPQQPSDTHEMEVRASHETSPNGSGMIAEHAWGNDHLWLFLIPKSVPARLTNSEGVPVFGHPSNEASHRPIYQIGPDAGDDGPQAVHGSGSPHDHVLPVPPKNKGSYTAAWHFKVVFATQEAIDDGDVATSGDPVPLPSGTRFLAHAADTDGDGKLEDLTSAEKVQAAADRGDVDIFSTPLVFVCPVRDIEG